MTNQAVVNFQNEKAGLEKMLELLAAEQSALLSSDLAALKSIVEDKNRTLATITELTNIRHNDMERNGYPLTKDGVTGWLAHKLGSEDNSENLKGDWDELLKITERNKEQNRINGLLISKHAMMNNQALKSLSPDHNTTYTYGPSGHENTKLRQRTLVVG